MHSQRSHSRPSNLTAYEISPSAHKEGTGKLLSLLLWCIALGILAGFFFYFERWQSNVSLADFRVFYEAALDVRFGRDPFRPALTALQVISQNRVASTGSYFLYPLPFALILVPLTFLPLEIAGMIWSAMSIATFVLTIKLLVQICYKDAWQSLTPLLVICCSMIGIVHNELKLGQVDLMLTCLVVSSYFAYRHERNVVAGVLLALAVIIKPYLGLILLYFLWKRAYRVAVGFLLTSLLCFSMALIVAGWQSNVEWVQVTHLLTSVPRASQVAVVSLYSLLLRLFTTTLSARPWIELGTWPAIVGSLLLGCIVAILVLRSVRRGKIDPETAALEFALWVAATLLVFPELEDIHVIPAIIVLVVAVLSVPWRRIKQYFYLPVNIYPLLVFLYFVNPLLPRWQWFNDVTPVTGWQILETGAYLLGLLLLFICVQALLHKHIEGEKSAGN